MLDKCKSCEYRWYGNYEHKTFADWYCRIGKQIKRPTVSPCKASPGQADNGAGKADTI